MFDAQNDITPFALGPLKLSTNALNAIGITGYPRNKYTPIYEDFFIPELITNSCIEFDGSIGNIKSSIITYSSSESYSKELAKSNSISVDVSASGGGGGFEAAASAGYAESTKRRTAGSGLTRSAYGRRQTIKEIAKISINCLNKRSFVALELQELIRPEVVKDWTFIRDFNETKNKTKEDLKKTSQFLRIARGGFLQPTTYLYSATVRLSTDTEYTETNSDDSSDVSEDITASLSASYSGAFVTGDITASTAVSNAIKGKLEARKIDSRSETVRIATGTPNITSDCILGSNPKPCEQVVTDEVATVFGDINNFVTVPSEQIGSVSLDEIVKGYFNESIGLGATFFEAVNEEFGSIDIQEGNVSLVYFLQEFGCKNNEKALQFTLELNKCTLFSRGPPKSIYVKVSIEGQSYKVTQAPNKECIPTAGNGGESMFPFGVCSDGSSTPGILLDDISDFFIDKAEKFLNKIKFAKNVTIPRGIFSVFLSDREVVVDNDVVDCTKINAEGLPNCFE